MEARSTSTSFRSFSTTVAACCSAIVSASREVPVGVRHAAERRLVGSEPGQGLGVGGIGRERRFERRDRRLELVQIGLDHGEPETDVRSLRRQLDRAAKRRCGLPVAPELGERLALLDARRPAAKTA